LHKKSKNKEEKMKKKILLIVVFIILALGQTGCTFREWVEILMAPCENVSISVSLDSTNGDTVVTVSKEAFYKQVVVLPTAENVITDDVNALKIFTYDSSIQNGIIEIHNNMSLTGDACKTFNWTRP